MPITRDQVQRRVVRGARIVRFEQGKRTSYSDGALIWLTAAELVKYQFIVEPVPTAKPPVAPPAAPAVAKQESKQEPKHEVRNGVPPATFSNKK